MCTTGLIRAKTYIIVEAKTTEFKGKLRLFMPYIIPRALVISVVVPVILAPTGKSLLD
jgi:hypothetical protein